jgi:hypothetical protein
MLWGTLCPITLHVAPREAVRVASPATAAKTDVVHASMAVDAVSEKPVESSRDRLPHSGNA